MHLFFNGTKNAPNNVFCFISLQLMFVMLIFMFVLLIFMEKGIKEKMGVG